MMKRWLISLAMSVLISCLGLAYFISSIQGGDGDNGYSMQALTSPLAISIFLGIILGISSALLQIHTLLFRSSNAKR